MSEKDFIVELSSNKLAANQTYNISTGGSYSSKAIDGVFTKGSYTSGTLLGSVTMSSKSASVGKSSGMGGFGSKGSPGSGGRVPPGKQ